MTAFNFRECVITTADSHNGRNRLGKSLSQWFIVWCFFGRSFNRPVAASSLPVRYAVPQAANR